MAEAQHPLHLANALDVLRVELAEAMCGEEAAYTLSLLRLELGFATGQGRAWALERGLRFDFPEPRGDCNAFECVLMLQRLATALRGLAARSAERPMNDNAWPEDENA